MTSAASLAVCGLITSCTHDIDYEGSAQSTVVKKYEEAFITAFGQPDPNNEWGFGPSTVANSRAMTRTNQGEDYPATSTGINANANEWADPTPGKEFGGWVVPDPLTEEQKAVVKAYFQANPNLRYDDPELRHFFVQQVYKGGTSVGLNSTEVTIAANGSSSYNSSNMDLLTVGENEQHINNFNGGTYGTEDGQSGVGVLDKGYTANDFGSHHHTDQIMLMVNIDDTSCFGYHNSGCSKQINDKAALVGWETIRTWANNNGLNGNCLDDGWNRSFLGFDLALLSYDDVKSDVYANYSDAPANPEYIWDGTNRIKIVTGYDQYWNKIYADDYIHMKDKNGNWLTYVSTNTSMYESSAKVTLAQENGMEGVMCRVDGQPCVNMAVLQPLINQGYLPVKDKNLTEWVKIGYGDGYFSDWIVTLTEAKRQGEHHEDIEGELRVIAEDLSVTQASDWDFNDVVFDVQLADQNTSVKITLRAAGGTLPLVIGGTDVEDYHEVHAEFAKANPGKNITTSTMINTINGDRSYATPTFYLKAKSEWFANAPDEPNGLLKAVAKNMPVEVYKLEKGTKTWVLMECDKGQPAAKIAVSKKYNWCDERAHIDKVYKYKDSKGNEYGGFTLFARGILNAEEWYNYKGLITDDMVNKYLGRQDEILQ